MSNVPPPNNNEPIKSAPVVAAVQVVEDDPYFGDCVIHIVGPGGCTCGPDNNWRGKLLYTEDY